MVFKYCCKFALFILSVNVEVSTKAVNTSVGGYYYQIMLRMLKSIPQSIGYPVIGLILGLCFVSAPIISCSSPEIAPNLVLTSYGNSDDDFENNKISLDDFRGNAVVLNFWAPLCPPCRSEMPLFESYWQEVRGNGVMVLGADVGPALGMGSEDQAREFIEQIGVTYPTGKTNSGSVVDSYNILGMPTTVFISPDGVIKHTWIGSIEEEDLFRLTKEFIQ